MYYTVGIHSATEVDGHSIIDATLAVMDELAEGHDELVLEWQDTLKETLPVCPRDDVCS